jgi:hypothetical protein
MGWEFRQGTMRWVVLTSRYAIKIAGVRPMTFRLELAQGTVLEGFRANRQERRRWLSFPEPRLCPVLWGDRFGIMLVMERAHPLEDREFAELEMRYISEGSFSGHHFYLGDMKRENYGTL